MLRIRRLTALETAHLNRILQLSPDDPRARQRLGFQRVNGTWVRGRDLWQGLQQGEQAAESLAKWQRRLEELRRSLRRNAPALTAQTVENCKADLTADAVPALEILLAELSTPIESQYQAVLENGRIRYRHEFVPNFPCSIVLREDQLRAIHCGQKSGLEPGWRERLRTALASPSVFCRPADLLFLEAG